MSGGPEFSDLATDTLAALRARGWMVATAESCTGGMIAAALTSIAGSSDVVDRGFVTYSNEAKTEMLGVPAPMIDGHGAVSAEVAAAMAQGALDHSRAGLAVSVTGIAGPGGATPGKPVGLVWFGLGQRGAPSTAMRQVFAGDRAAVRAQATQYALTLLQQAALSET